ncbi:MAG: DUF3604 domain-containing protein [Anaerolineae bacterium]|nr:DUF3604 domain-containing protein [Anaerolineae bacterium]
MASALEQVAWPAAVCDSQGGLWLACRSFVADDTPQPPALTIQVATSWTRLQPRVVAEGPHLSPPALVLDRLNPAGEVVRVAWLAGPGGSEGVRVAAVAADPTPGPSPSQGGAPDLETVPDETGHVGRLGLVGATDSAGVAWLAWQTVTGRGGTIQVSRREADGWTPPETVSDPAQPASEPCLAADLQGNLWVGWTGFTGSGFRLTLRRRLASGVWEEAVTTGETDAIDLEPSLDVDAQGRVYAAWKRVAGRWGTLAGARLNEDTQVYLRVYDPARQVWTNLGDSDGRVPLPSTGRSGSIAGRETLATWAPPLAPRVLVDAEGGVRLLFRRFRDLHPVYDWGHDLYATTWTPDGWTEPMLVSHTAGFPEAQHLALRMADGGVAVVYQYSHQPPTYWHCPDDHTDTIIGHSGIAVTRQMWGGKLPTVRKIGPARAENLQPGTPDLSGSLTEPPSTVTLSAAKSLSSHHRDASPAASSMRRTMQHDMYSVLGNEMCFFGDLHNHSNLSTDMVNKDGGLRDHYRFGRDFVGYDFYALTDHVEESGPAGWLDSLDMADAFTRAGGFVAWYALEWTNRIPADGRGSLQDTCVFCADREAAWTVRHLARQIPDGSRLLPRLDQAGLRGRVFIIRHFHGGRGYGLDLDEPCNQFMAQAGPGVEPVIELVQMRGPCLPIYQALLSRGVRRGVIGGTDHGRPGGRVFVNGTTGIWSPALTREALFQAVGRRRTFATNGARLALDFGVGDTPMGGETTASGPVHLRGFVVGTQPVRQVTVYRDGEAWQTLAPNTPRVELDLTDTPARGEHYYWLHAVQDAEQGQAYPGEGWSSPLWVMVE